MGLNDRDWYRDEINKKNNIIKKKLNQEKNTYSYYFNKLNKKVSFWNLLIKALLLLGGFFIIIEAAIKLKDLA